MVAREEQQVQPRLARRRVREFGKELVTLVSARARFAGQVVELVDRGVDRAPAALSPRLDEIPDGQVHQPGRRFAR